MQTETRTLLTVITEANLEPTLLRTLTREGLRGYTITDARGRGSPVSFSLSLLTPSQTTRQCRSRWA
ncbi:P-II family nitrogen regulator, partial [Aeromonas salmonicida]|uniref:P-II family nitrogen regulator n=1 Tax=Aeromonas salmonicida TaxID=645 RepID=UPI003D31389F